MQIIDANAQNTPYWHQSVCKDCKFCTGMLAFFYEEMMDVNVTETGHYTASCICSCNLKLKPRIQNWENNIKDINLPPNQMSALTTFANYYFCQNHCNGHSCNTLIMTIHIHVFPQLFKISPILT